MKRYVIPIFLLAVLFTSCTDDLTGARPSAITVDDTDLVGCRMKLGVAAMEIRTVATTRADGGDADDSEEMQEDVDLRGTDAERRIDNIWVFQFDASSGDLLITPRYYDISDRNASPDETDGTEVDVLLKPDVESIVYVVANTGSSTWATVYNSPKLDSVRHLTLPSPDFIAVNVGGDLDVRARRIPMEGASAAVTPHDNGTVSVQVTRMYAKMEIIIGYIPETLDITDVEVGNIPYYCRVGSLDMDDENDAQRAHYPKDTQWIGHAFKPGARDGEGKYTGTMVVYVPENLQGQLQNGNPNDPGLKTSMAFADALYLNFKADYKNLFTGNIEDAGRSYVFYPGGNNYSDFNIKRNNIYRITLNIYTDRYNQDTPSANCFVVKPGQLLSFLPYYRTEEGGGYHIEDYLCPDGDESKRINNSKTMTENVRIIWQTKDAIGDNTKGDKVWIDPSGTDDTKNRKIYVQAGAEGNALIAAYNSSGEIVWSWHIWITNNEPANLSSAITYSTYAWNENGIYTDIRVPGYAIMPCNLGALRYEPESDDIIIFRDGSTDKKLSPGTHGMLYQWGRKDPFPPAVTGNNVSYDDVHTGYHYGNDNNTLVTKTSGTDTSLLFHSLAGGSIKTETNGDAVGYTIKNPTVFLCGTTAAGQNEDYLYNDANYTYNGDWNPKHDAKLWGGLAPVTDGTMKSLQISSIADIFDNYGDQKSIFDPCPSGWRVPPGDLWLGFTSTGMDPKVFSQVNTDTKKNSTYPNAGMYLYMTDWKEGGTSFFPTQGTRTPDGRIMRTGSCGNYHNATTDLNDRVNILHVHNNSTLFHVFETQYRFYYVKSTGGPVRCVRDHK